MTLPRPAPELISGAVGGTTTAHAPGKDDDTMQFELWRGRSRIDGAPIVALANGPSPYNRKTGPMLQTWILRGDVDPVTAIRRGADRSICGDCLLGPGRPDGANRACYVSPARGPVAIWRSWKAGGYRVAHAPAERRALARGLSVRLGAYGDPAAVPLAVWTDLLGDAAGWTGYTHQWRDGFALSDLVMASTESDAASDAAAALGWRVFQVTGPGAARRPGFAVCPHVTSGGRVQCHACGLCDGTARGPGLHVQTPAHGPGASRSALVVLRIAAAKGDA